VVAVIWAIVVDTAALGGIFGRSRCLRRKSRRLQFVGPQVAFMAKVKSNPWFLSNDIDTFEPLYPLPKDDRNRQFTCLHQPHKLALKLF
jgi:hypothetical protein